MIKHLLRVVIVSVIAIHVTTAQRPNMQRLNMQKIKITGSVIDQETSQPLEYATIIFQHTRRPNIQTGGITDESGNFEIEIFPGVYNIRVEFISFQPLEIKEKELREDTSLGTLSLKLDVQSLSEVDVIAERTQVEIKLDKKVYNVGKDLIVKGGTISDVLDNVPSVTVDVEGNISLRGNESVRILIDGKPSGFVNSNSADALRLLPAESIEKVEVITSPSARYDAEGTAGIINIILKKGKAQGINGSVQLTTGIPDNHGVSLNLNIRKEKFNIFTTTGYNYRNIPGEANNETEFLSPNAQNRFLTENRDFERLRRSFNSNTGIEFFISDKASVSTSLFYRRFDGDNETDNISQRFDASRQATSRTLRFQEEEEIREIMQWSFNYTQDFKKEDHKLIINFQHENNNDNEDAFISEEEFIVPNIPDDLDRVRTFEDEKVTLIQSDYVLPIGKNSQFELGTRSNLTLLNTEYIVDTLQNGILINNANLSNTLLYKENIHAIYSQFGSKKGKFSYLLGLRVEISDIDIDQRTIQEKIKKDYTDFFPTINLGYEISDSENLTLGFNRRIRRPRSRFINPFPSLSSETNLFQGNPDLDPTYTNSLDFGYLKRWSKLTLNGSVYYQKTTQVFEFIVEPTGDFTDNGDEIVRRFPVNLSDNDRYGFELTTLYSPFKWLRLNGNINLFRSITRGDFNNISFDAENTSWFARLNSQITANKKTSAQINMFYSGPRITAQNDSKGIFSLSLGLSRDVLKDKGTIALNLNDVFNSRKRITETTTPSLLTESEFQFRKRLFTASFTYRFNQSKRDSQRRNRQQDFDDNDDFGG
ncbi:TonB-dependent receptor domain-containing protein [Leptobacterium sp. I13]|uniref:TonB-dependent receptor domain-containing protein n=1 Tax=Leptobacterium meishanense TaxID=3128904 RepID=UPI0030EB6351